MQKTMNCVIVNSKYDRLKFRGFERNPLFFFTNSESEEILKHYKIPASHIFQLFFPPEDIADYYYIRIYDAFNKHRQFFQFSDYNLLDLYLWDLVTVYFADIFYKIDLSKVLAEKFKHIHLSATKSPPVYIEKEDILSTPPYQNEYYHILRALSQKSDITVTRCKSPILLRRAKIHLINFMAQKLNSFVFFCRKIFGQPLPKSAILKSKHKILFLIKTLNQAKTALSIIQHLSPNDYLLIIYDSWLNNDIANFLKKRDIPFIRFEKFYRSKYKYRPPQNMPDITYNDINIAETFSHKFKILFRHRFKVLIRELTSLENLYLLLKPSLVVTLNDHNPFGVAAFAVAKKFGVKSISIQHGPRDLKMAPLAKPDYICLMGEHDRELYKKLGFSEKQIFVTGQTRFDELYRKNLKFSKEEIKNLRAELNIPPDAPILLYTSQAPENYIDRIQRQKLLSHLDALLNDIPELHLIVKLHPTEREIEIKEKPNVHILKNYDIFKLFKAADAMLSLFSTTIIEATLLGVPVIVPNFLDIQPKMEFASTPPVVMVRTYAELKQNLLLIIKSPQVSDYERQRSEFIKKFAYKFDGLASQRVAEILRRLGTV